MTEPHHRRSGCESSHKHIVGHGKRRNPTASHRQRCSTGYSRPNWIQRTKLQLQASVCTGTHGTDMNEHVSEPHGVHTIKRRQEREQEQTHGASHNPPCPTAKTAKNPSNATHLDAGSTGSNCGHKSTIRRAAHGPPVGARHRERATGVHDREVRKQAGRESGVSHSSDAHTAHTTAPTRCMSVVGTISVWSWV